jgi:hypothetical protein
MNLHLAYFLCFLSLICSGCGASPSTVKQPPLAPIVQVTPSPESVAYIPDQFGEPLGTLNTSYTEEDKLTYSGYEVLKMTRRVKASNPKGYTEVDYAVLKLNGKIVATFDGRPEQLSEVRFGLFPFLDGETKQLLVEQTSNKFWQYWILELSPRLKVIFDGGKYDLVHELRIIDLDRDGRYELVQGLGTFWYFNMLGNVDSPRPPIIFKYEAHQGRYIPANQEFQKVALEDIEQRINKARKLRALNHAAALDILLRFLYAGKKHEAWSFYEREYKEADKEEYKSEINKKLRKDAVYRAIYNNSAT